MLSLPQAQLDDYADKLILNSAQSSFTKLYECVLPHVLSACVTDADEDVLYLFFFRRLQPVPELQSGCAVD